jgi:sugar O-acyltransferase (sialic acid O-acetyltransferase NeuD family)
MKKQKIILLGGGGHCISCIDVIEQTNMFEIAGILDAPSMIGQYVLGYPVLGTDELIPKLVAQGYVFHITVGQIKSSAVRQKLYHLLKNAGAELPVIVSPAAIVSRHAEIGEGTIVMHQVVVNASAQIGICNIINTASVVEHEAVTGDFCHISTGVFLNGQVKVGNRCFIGSHTVVNNNITIVSDVVVASAARVAAGISKPGVYGGNPMRKVS